MVPACNPSRTAILTGLSPVTSGVYTNSQSWKTLLPDVVTLPQYFKQNGYAAKGGGKIFHHGGTGTDREENPSFDEFFKLQIRANKPGVNYNGYVRGHDQPQLASPSWDWGVHDVANRGLHLRQYDAAAGGASRKPQEDGTVLSGRGGLRG